MLKNDLLDQWDRENFFHPSTHLAQHARGDSPSRVIKTASGVYIEDRDGHKLLDAFAGLYCVNAGYGRQEITDAIAAQAKELAYYHSYVGHGTEASITLLFPPGGSGAKRGGVCGPLRDQFGRDDCARGRRYHRRLYWRASAWDRRDRSAAGGLLAGYSRGVEEA